MKRLTFFPMVRLPVWVGCGLLAFAPSTSPAQESSFFMRFEAGLNLVEDVRIKKFLFPTPGRKEKLDPGFRFDLTPGAHVTPWFDVEFNTGFLFNRFRDIDASLMHMPLLMNLVVHLPNDTPFSPYAGIGGGGDVAFVHWDDAFMYTSRGWVGADGVEAAWTWSYQAMAGICWTPVDNTAISLGYKFTGTTAPSFEEGWTKFGDVHNHSVLLGISLNW
ncbi:MAG: outer membrane beta-barrel protein [Verrucomicrobia bacterium]|nr:outer membrane beta-barrel protein [Verrucomicrobiota bacterium]